MSNSRFEYVKQYECHSELLKNTYIVIRVDGKGFTKFTESHQYEKPNDIRGIRLMMLAGLKVMNTYSEIFMGYGESDEFSFVFSRKAKLYNRRSEKILTNVVSEFTSAYVYYWNKCFEILERNFKNDFILYYSIINYFNIYLFY